MNPNSTIDYPELVHEAVTKALKDANLQYNDIQQACIGYCFGDSTSGQRALYTVGLTGIPIYNLNNNCATGSSAVYLAKQLIDTGNTDCVLAVGFDKMDRGPLKPKVCFTHELTKKKSISDHFMNNILYVVFRSSNSTRKAYGCIS